MQNAIKALREKHGLTLEALGKRVGKSKQYISELEKGRIRLTYDMAVKIAAAVGSTPDEIFLPSESKKLVPEDNERFTTEGQQVG